MSRKKENAARFSTLTVRCKRDFDDVSGSSSSSNSSGDDRKRSTCNHEKMSFLPLVAHHQQQQQQLMAAAERCHFYHSHLRRNAVKTALNEVDRTNPSLYFVEEEKFNATCRRRITRRVAKGTCLYTTRKKKTT